MRVESRPTMALAIAIVAAACTPAGSSKPAPSASTTAVAATSARPTTSVNAATSASSTLAPIAASASASVASASSAAPASSARAGADGCRTLRGPIALPYVGPVALVAGPDASSPPRAVFNLNGEAKVIAVAERDAGAPDKSTSPACAIAADVSYCVDPGGTIKRARLSGQELSTIANARPGSPIAAASLPNGHGVVAFLSDKKTTEGRILVALAALDDRPSVQLSEDGAGANSVALAARGDRVFATYVDARTALTPVHARTLEVEGTRLKASKDAVVFVGEGSTHVVPTALGIASTGEAFALLATDKDLTTFGMAAIKLTPDPVDDAPVAWSLYPGGMASAPVAATAGSSSIHVARVRTTKAEEGAPRVLELGRLDDKGAFVTTCTIAQAPSITDVAMVLGAEGSIWVAYTKAGTTWIEERREKTP